MSFLDPILYQLLTYHRYPTEGAPSTLLGYTLEAFSRIPYENLSKIVRHAESCNSRAKESPAELIHGYIEHGTGGTCFPLTKTLVHVVRSLGYEAYPILADRRYGTDTHCAVIARLTSNDWELLDPGYLIHTPCRLPDTYQLRYELPFSAIELRPEGTPSRVALYTHSLNESGVLHPRYRLTYKIHPVSDTECDAAWDRSFDWEMMRYPIISCTVGASQLYLQKNSLLIRSRTEATRVTLRDEEILREVSSRFGISVEMLKRYQVTR